MLTFETIEDLVLYMDALETLGRDGLYYLHLIG